ncbi:hypothetical protein N7468_006264 [Penicillium chermesinum]|uniref:Uncharacterized protein n=1 Tax=Penicillium chermesinum TaxID=63820 RepID=A0A9W9NUQ5_9EURO|nr:uncharacterized protein N7468_006264 [Penicillium chermesinum]KAJ5225039.1 hypothetical protein N7468_006264 [Penicillium chermesinum]KAJ6151768.1 hypothetical protein N7470_006896 [Penicillium chermesinum]
MWHCETFSHSVVLWPCLAFLASATLVRLKSFPFDIGWWGFIFLLRVFTAITVQVGSELPFRFFNILGMVNTPNDDTLDMRDGHLDYCEYQKFEKCDTGGNISRTLPRGIACSDRGEWQSSMRTLFAG